ncbi:DUF938 domain-containing protein [Roseospira navarrensis]|uniref:DUF938 domain-containing protein n=1 Tax=Roseospira navarrensis TaxID=140058 RepID=A0A7X2D2B0_9PROT|nr:DUF938 domain-containing protein [Roseospira navarrensis]
MSSASPEVAVSLEDPPPRSPAVARNRAPIRDVLTRALPPSGTMLEVACGTGEHAAFLAGALPGWRWLPTEADRTMAGHAAALLTAEGPDTVEPVRLFDVRTRPWPEALTDGVSAILAVNLIHISPWAVTEALMAGAGAALPPGGVLYLYGPYRREGRHTAPSNAAFDADLRARDPSWGVRDLEAVTAEAARHGLALAETVDMPANNLSVVFRKG